MFDRSSGQRSSALRLRVAEYAIIQKDVPVLGVETIDVQQRVISVGSTTGCISAGYRAPRVAFAWQQFPTTLRAGGSIDPALASYHGCAIVEGRAVASDEQGKNVSHPFGLGDASVKLF